jgi:nicotinate-nucleotide adenylyltransferase
MHPAQPAARVAFFGGSFDPPHMGHLAIARAAREALRLDTVLFAPVGSQPLKPNGATASFEDRLAMTRLAIADENGFEISLIDAPRPGAAQPDYTPNYTFDTLTSLRTSLSSGSKLFCLVGADSLLSLRQWHRANEIPFAAEMIVASRPGQPLKDLKAALPESLALTLVEKKECSGVDLRDYLIADASGRSAHFYLLPGLNVEISASAIRSQIKAIKADAEGRRKPLVPRAVAQYIRGHALYG